MSGKEQQSRNNINWRECCLKKKYDGLGLVNPEAAKTSFLCKWIVRAMEPGKSNLQLMLRFRILNHKEVVVGVLALIGSQISKFKILRYEGVGKS